MIQLLAKPIREELINKINERKKGTNLSFLLFYDKDNLDCLAYVNSIIRLLKKLEINYTELIYNNKLSIEENLYIFKENIKDNSVLIARPLPIKNEKLFIDQIPTNQDVDMLSDINRGKLFEGNLKYLPATCRSVKEILEFYKIETLNKKVTIIGRSISVGLPMFELFSIKNATVTQVHSKTDVKIKNEAIKNADILVLASGKKNLVERELLNQNKVIIDCGYSNNTGDLNFTPEDNECSMYTPVPGGVGGLTSYCLILNAIDLKLEK